MVEGYFNDITNPDENTKVYKMSMNNLDIIVHSQCNALHRCYLTMIYLSNLFKQSRNIKVILPYLDELIGQVTQPFAALYFSYYAATKISKMIGRSESVDEEAREKLYKYFKENSDFMIAMYSRLGQTKNRKEVPKAVVSEWKKVCGSLLTINIISVARYELFDPKLIEKANCVERYRKNIEISDNSDRNDSETPGQFMENTEYMPALFDFFRSVEGITNDFVRGKYLKVLVSAELFCEWRINSRFLKNESHLKSDIEFVQDSDEEDSNGDA